MSNIRGMKCEVCRVEAPRVTDEELAELRTEVPGWDVTEAEGVRRLQKMFKFKDFVSALSFTDRIGGIAEEQGHHPVIVTEWGKVTVTWWTHKIGGLHLNDFVMAAKTDALVQE